MVEDLAAYFYIYNGLATSNQTERLQMSFDVLIYLFNRVGIQTNLQQIVSMECKPRHTPVSTPEVAYEIRTMGVGSTYWERQRQVCVVYGECICPSRRVADGSMSDPTRIGMGGA